MRNFILVEDPKITQARLESDSTCSHVIKKGTLPIFSGLCTWRSWGDIIKALSTRQGIFHLNPNEYICQLTIDKTGITFYIDSH